MGQNKKPTPKKKKNSANNNKEFKVDSKKTGKSVTVKASTVKKAAKKVKKLPKKQRLAVSIVFLLVLAAAVFIFDARVMPLEYIPVNFVKQNSFLGDKQMKLHFLDVGQGDSIIIEFPDDTKMIIDSGDGKTASWQHILKYAQTLGIKTFDYMMLTHSDSDHVGGFTRVLDFFEVKTIYIPDIEDKNVANVSSTYQKFIAAVNAETYTDSSGNVQSAQKIKTLAGQVITTTNPDNQFFMAVLSPFVERYDELNDALSNLKATAAQKNDVSAVVYIEYLNTKTVLTGDANVLVEDDIVAKFNSGVYNNALGQPFFTDGQVEYNINLQNIDILKAGHHGSKGSTGKKFLELLQPSYTVISVGKNSYGHPHKDVLSALQKSGSIVYQTFVGGDIVALVSPSNSKGIISFEFSKNDFYQFRAVEVFYSKPKYAA